MFNVESMNWNFINIRAGMKYALSRWFDAYAMFGRSNREPTRADYFQDEFPYNDIKQSDIKPETVNDFELGATFRNKNIFVNANIFDMIFDNQIANTGKLNNYGYAISTNVGASYRRGFEMDWLWKINKYVWLNNSSSFSDNKIDNIDLHYTSANSPDTVISKQNVSAALSPSIIINQGLRIIPLSWIYLQLDYRYVSMQYLDNSNDKNISAPAFNYINARIGFNLKKLLKTGEPMLSVQINNLTNELYSSAGNVQGYTNTINSGGQIGTVPLYFPAATRNFFVTLSWKF